jgi:hypothetical protein
LLAIALCACSIPDKHPGSIGDGGTSDGTGEIDGATGPLRCLGQPLPTTAPPQITLTVQTIDATDGDPLAGMTVTGLMLAPQTTDAEGKTSLTAMTGSVPVDSYITATIATRMTSHAYPSRPYDQDQQLTVPTLSFNDMASLTSAAGTVFETTDAQLTITVVDCDGAPLSGAKVVAATGEIFYEVSGVPTSSATATDSTGIAYVFNAASGAFTVAATASNGAALRTHVVDAPGGDWTQAAIQP